MRGSLHAFSPPGNPHTLPTLPALLLVSEAASVSSWAGAWVRPTPPSTLVSHQHLRPPAAPPTVEQTPGLKPRQAMELAPTLLTEPPGQASPHPYFSSGSRLTHALLVKASLPEKARDGTQHCFLPTPVPLYRTNHHLWSDPFSPDWGQASPSSPEGRGFLAAKRAPPATYLSLFPSSSLEPLPLNPNKFMAAAG